MVSLIRQRERLRVELEDFAVAQERVRLARDLHDLLGVRPPGYQPEVRTRGTPRRGGPHRVSRELDETSDLVRQCLVDVRTVGRRRHRTRPREGADPGCPGAAGDRPGRVGPDRAHLAEGWETPGLRRSWFVRPQRMCYPRPAPRAAPIAIAQELGAARVEVDNDGASPPSRSGISGSANPAARVEATGGTTATVRHQPNLFRLTVLILLAVPTSAGVRIGGQRAQRGARRRREGSPQVAASASSGSERLRRCGVGGPSRAWFALGDEGEDLP